MVIFPNPRTESPAVSQILSNSLFDFVFTGQPNSLSTLNKPDRLTVSKLWSGLCKPHTAGVIAHRFFLGAVSVKIPCLLYCISRGAKATLTLR